MLIKITDEQRARASKWVTLTGNDEVDGVLIAQLELSRGLVAKGIKNDFTSMTLSQAYNYSFVVTFNIESLQWFLSQREKKAAHWDIQNFAKMLRNNIPEQYKYLFEEKE